MTHLFSNEMGAQSNEKFEGRNFIDPANGLAKATVWSSVRTEEEAVANFF